MEAQVEKPTYLKKVHMDYLDDMKRSGIINMNATIPFLKNAFHLTPNKAIKIMKYWKYSTDYKQEEF